MIEQLPCEPPSLQKTGRAAAARPVCKAFGMPEFAEVLKQEAVEQQASNETDALEAEEPDTLPLEPPRHEMLRSFDFLAITHGAEVPPDEHNSPQDTKLRTAIRIAQVEQMGDGLPTVGTTQLDEAPATMESPKPMARQNFALGVALAVQGSAPAIVTQPEDSPAEHVELGLEDEAEQGFSNSAARHDVSSVDDRSSFKSGALAQESNAASEQIASGPSSVPLGQVIAIASPARQILSQLEAPVAAAVSSAAATEETALLRHLTVSITPGELGTISVTLRMQDKKLSIIIGASVPETAELLRQDLSLLDEVLRPLTGDGIAPVITILTRDAETAASSFSEIGNGRESAPHFRESGAGRERSFTGKESGSTQADERTPLHEEISSGRRILPGTLVL